MRDATNAVDPSFARATTVVLAVAIGIPLVISALSLVFFLLVFYLEDILIGSYPFLATIRVGVSSATYAIAFPFNWILTLIQWSAFALLFAFRARAKGVTDLGSQVIMACALWFATNLFVRLTFLAFGLHFVTTQVRM